MKYIIRSGKVKGEGLYFCLDPDPCDGVFLAKLHPRGRFAERAGADSVLELAEQIIGRHCRIVPLLSADEAKRKFAAGVLREAVVRHVANPHDGARLMQMADELWPAKGER